MDLEGLARELEEAHTHVEEQASIVQARGEARPGARRLHALLESRRRVLTPCPDTPHAQALSADLAKVQQLVAGATEAAGLGAGGTSGGALADPASSAHLGDTVHMLETMHDTHAHHLVPRVAACDRSLEAFASRCLDCKVRQASARLARGEGLGLAQRKYLCKYNASTAAAAAQYAQSLTWPGASAPPRPPCRTRSHATFSASCRRLQASRAKFGI